MEIGAVAEVGSLLTLLWSQGAFKQPSYKEGQSKALTGSWFTSCNKDSMILRNKCILFLGAPSWGQGQMASDLLLFEAGNFFLSQSQHSKDDQG